MSLPPGEVGDQQRLDRRRVRVVPWLMLVKCRRCPGVIGVPPG